MKPFFKILLAFTMLFVLSQAFTPMKTEAQYITRLAKDSASASQTRYVTFTSTPNLIKSISLTALASSGTMSITSVTLESRIDTISGGTDWITVPASVAVTATAQVLSSTVYQFHLLDHSANGYRIKIVTPAVSQKTYLYGSYLRRTQ